MRVISAKDGLKEVHFAAGKMGEEEICRFLADAGINFETAKITKTDADVPEIQSQKRFVIAGRWHIRRTI